MVVVMVVVVMVVVVVVEWYVGLEEIMVRLCVS